MISSFRRRQHPPRSSCGCPALRTLHYPADWNQIASAFKPPVSEIVCHEHRSRIVAARHHEARPFPIQISDSGEKTVHAVSVAVSQSSSLPRGGSYSTVVSASPVSPLNTVKYSGPDRILPCSFLKSACSSPMMCPFRLLCRRLFSWRFLLFRHRPGHKP